MIVLSGGSPPRFPGAVAVSVLFIRIVADIDASVGVVTFIKGIGGRHGLRYALFSRNRAWLSLLVRRITKHFSCPVRAVAYKWRRSISSEAKACVIRLSIPGLWGISIKITSSSTARHPFSLSTLVAKGILSGQGIGQRDDCLHFVEELLGDVLSRISISSGYGMNCCVGHS